MSNSKSIMSQNNPFIPLHVVEEILLYLDAQTLIQYACLCRDWNSLITSPDFISRYSNRTSCSRKEVILAKFLRGKDRELSKLVPGRILAFEESYSLHLDNDQFDLIRTTERPSINGPKVSKIVGASNGLVCLVDYPLDFVLWNPTIQRYILLPRPPVTPRVLHNYILAGFGFDHKSNDFKVVIIVYHNCKVNLAVWVFSYLTWSWKLVANTPPPFLVHDLVHKVESNVVINGVLHWVVWNTATANDFIITFDLSHELFGKILLPSGIANDVPISIFAAGDSIAVLVEKHISGATTWFVWFMKQYGFHESWTNIVTTHEWLTRKVLDIRKNRDMILQMRGGQILRYNPSTRAINVLRGITPLRPLDDEAVFIGSHKENLYLLDKGEHVNS